MLKEPVNTNPFNLVMTKEQVQKEAKEALAEYRRTGIPEAGPIEDLDMDFSRLGPDPEEKNKNQ